MRKQRRQAHLVLLAIVPMLALACGAPELFAPRPKGSTTVPIARLETSLGVIELELFAEVAPLAVENFRALATRGYYESVTFHRVIPGFIVQSGDPTGTGYGGESIWGTPFEDEFDSTVTFDRAGRLGMANWGPDTNGSQFFITLAPTPHLNNRHTIFGQVRAGMEVVTAISEVEMDPSTFRPLEPVVIQRVLIRVEYLGGSAGTWTPPDLTHRVLLDRPASSG